MAKKRDKALFGAATLGLGAAAVWWILNRPAEAVQCGTNSHLENGVCVCDTGYHMENGTCVQDTTPPGDTTAPILTITSPTRNQSVSSTAPLTVAGTATEEAGGSGIDNVRARRKQPAPSDVGDPFVTATPAAPGDWSSWSVTLPPPSDITYTAIFARAIDKAGNVGRGTVHVIYDGTPPPPTITWFMNVQEFSQQDAVGAGTRMQVTGEWVRDGSALIGKNVNAMSAFVSRVGAPTGFVYFRVMDVNRNYKYTFGQADVADIPVEGTDLTIVNTAGYTIANDDRLVVIYAGGNATNYIRVGRIESDRFDASNTCRIFYGASQTDPTHMWRYAPTHDTTMSVGHT